METELLAHDAPGALERAVALLAAGEPVGLPTETVYGLAGDALNPAAAAAIFHAKERPLFDPLIVHLPDRDWAGRLTVAPRAAEPLLDRFWPGPLTLLLPRRPGAVPDLVTAGSSLVAVRISAHPVFAAVIGRFGGPLAAPSANRFGRISPTRAPDVMEELGGRIPLVLDGGPTDHGVESTIVEIAADGAFIIRRHGPVTAEALAEFGSVRTAGGGNKDLAPGELPGHYAPRTLLRLLDSRDGGAAGAALLGFRRDQPPAAAEHAAKIEWLSEAGDLREAATRLFGALRRLDGAGAPIILAELAPARGIGVAINERLARAASVRPAGGGLPIPDDS